MRIYRHGDVLLRQISVKDFTERTAKKGAKKSKHASFIVEAGEQTGHNHVLTCEKEFEVVTIGGMKFLALVEDGVLTHQEHKQLAIKKGRYEVLKEKEYDPFQRTVRQVRD